jgi:hypothetical protein
MHLTPYGCVVIRFKMLTYSVYARTHDIQTESTPCPWAGSTIFEMGI